MIASDNKTTYAFLSKNILALSEYEADAELLFTLSIYLKMLVIKAACTEDKLKIFTQNLLLQSGRRVSADFKIDEAGLDELFEGNKALLLDIKAEVWSGKYNEPLHWLPGWEEICRKTIDTTDQKDIATQFLLQVVNEHLEITPNHALVMLSLIYKSVDA